MTKPLILQKRFLPMWLGQSFGAISDNMNRQLLLIGVQFGIITLAGVENPEQAVPLIGTLFPIAMLIGSMYGGQFAEKYDTRLMFRRTKFVEVLLMMVAAFGLITQMGWVIVFALFGMGLQSSFFNPTRQSAMPKYLEPDELVRGNGIMNAGLYGCILLGIGLGGSLILREDDGAFISAVGLVLFSLLGYIAVWFAPPSPGTNPDLKIDWTGIRPTIVMFKFTFAEQSVIRPLIGLMLFYFVSTAITILLPIYVENTLGAGGGATTVFMLLFAVGAGVGAIIAATLARGRSGLGYSTVGIGLAALCIFLVYPLSLDLKTDVIAGAPLMDAATFFAQPQARILGGALCLSAVFLGIFIAPLQAAVQRRAPQERRSRILAVGNMGYAIAAIFGSLTVRLVTDFEAITPELAFIGVGIILACIAIYMVIRRSTVPAGQFDEMLTNYT